MTNEFNPHPLQFLPFTLTLAACIDVITPQGPSHLELHRIICYIIVRGSKVQTAQCSTHQPSTYCIQIDNDTVTRLHSNHATKSHFGCKETTITEGEQHSL
jgi:hypothetical protein